MTAPLTEDPPEGWVLLQVVRQAEQPVGIDMAFCRGCQEKVVTALRALAGPDVMSFDQIAAMVVLKGLQPGAQDKPRAS